jgi:hypothetical protein
VRVLTRLPAALLGLTACALAGSVAAATPPQPPATTTFGAAGRQALATLLNVYYAGNGSWNECNRPGCH